MIAPNFPSNPADCTFNTQAFFLLGHHLAFGSSPSPILPFIGWDEGFGQLFWREPPQGYGHQFYMYGFQAACVTIVSGAVAERTTIPAYLFLTFILSIFVQPAVMHWVWSSDGFFSASNLGSAGGVYLIDFAGSGVVHLIGGVASFQAAKVVGPRMKPQRFKNGKAMPIPSSNASFAVLGALILWFCWCVNVPAAVLGREAHSARGRFGFNAGSAMLVSEPVGEPHEACANSPFPNACMYLNGVKTPGYPVAELAMQNTAIAPMISCLTVTGIGYIMNGIRAQRRADAAKPQAVRSTAGTHTNKTSDRRIPTLFSAIPTTGGLLPYGSPLSAY
jgi:ammonia channel protein AmtB